MSASIFIYHFTLVFFLLFSTPIFSINITHLLSTYPDLSDFTDLLSTTSVAADLSNRSSVTLLVVPNTFLRSSDLLNDSSKFADILRYHVLLEYLPPDFHLIPPTGKLITTLFQTTGRAPNNFGSVNVTRNPITKSVTIHSPNSNATIISLVKTLPYNISIFTVDSVLVPNGINIMASDSRPLLGLNITKTLIDGHNFNVAASMLTASGVEEEFEQAEGGAGITLFIPTDQAFSDLSSSKAFQSLPAEKKADVLRFHVIHCYYPLGTLQSIVNPFQPTLATERNGAGSFTLNINSSANGSLAIDSGIVTASVTRTVFDQNPVAIFGISRVLLPREFFGKNPIEVNKAPVISVSPESSPAADGTAATRLSSPSELRDDVSSAGKLRTFLGLGCIGFLYLLAVN